MLRIAFTEIRYHAWTVVLWLAVSIAIGLAPLLMELSRVVPFPLLSHFAAQSLLTGISFMCLFLPVAAVSSVFRFLSVEGAEQRWRLFGTVPLSKTRLAVARLLRSLAIPAGVLLISLLMLVVATALSPARAGDLLREPWLILSVFLLGVATALLAILLHDLTSLTLAQGMVVVLAVPILLAFLVPEMRGWVTPLARMAITPNGPLLILATCAVLAVADIATILWRARLLRTPGRGTTQLA